MLKGKLVTAFDGRFTDKKHDKYSIYDSKLDTWYVWETGPTYRNCFHITECDDKGLNYLRSIESKHASPLE